MPFQFHSLSYAREPNAFAYMKINNSVVVSVEGNMYMPTHIDSIRGEND